LVPYRVVSVWVITIRPAALFNFFQILNGPINISKENQRGSTEALQSAKEPLRRIKEHLQSLYRASTEDQRGISSVFNAVREIEYRGSMWPEKLNTENQCGQRN
jgi:hypothetical protein